MAVLYSLPEVYDELKNHLESIETEDLAGLRESLRKHDEQLIREANDYFTAKKPNSNQRGQAINPNADHVALLSKLRSIGTSIYALLREIRSSSDLSVFEWDVEHFNEHYNSYIQFKPFESSFSSWVAKYVEEDNRNQFLQKNAIVGRKSVSALSEDQFRKRHGPPPWDLVDDVLRAAKVSYALNKPSYLPESTYKATLVDSEDEEIELTELSSGEKIILALFSSLHYVSEHDAMKFTLPKLLLLDEVDASLHPSLTKQLLGALNKLCEERDIYIFMTTHSATTVALSCDDQSVHILSKERDRSELKKSSIDNAISLLTEGIPTLSVRQELRRPVFVESHLDASYYEALYKIYVDNSQRSSDSPYLSFISAGGSHRGSCETVIEQVNALRGTGNTSILGVVDWDKKYETKDGIYVPGSGESKRYTVENYIFDPIAVGIYLVKEGLIAPEKLGFEVGMKYHKIIDLSKEKVEGLINIIITDVLGEVTDPVECTYSQGRKYNLPMNFLQHKGHEYLERMKEKYEIRNQKFELEIISKIYFNYPEIIPIEIFNIFGELERDHS